MQEQVEAVNHDVVVQISWRNAEPCKFEAIDDHVLLVHVHHSHDE